jgi:DNA-binding CsgD family transcriptional regulator
MDPGPRNVRTSTVIADARELLTHRRGPDMDGPNRHAAQLAGRCAELDALLTGPAGRHPERAAELCDVIAELNDLRNQLREHVIACRFEVLERIHEGLGRLRWVQTLAKLLPQAAEELARACDFDRAVVCAVRGSSWRPEAVWAAPVVHSGAEPRADELRTDTWLPLGSGALKTELVMHRRAVLVSGGPGTPYVAAPICADGRVVGFLRADCSERRRRLTTLDRDNIASFADGFGLVFERIALLDHLHRQCARVAGAFDAAGRHLTSLDDSETALIRHVREPVNGVRTTIAFRGTPRSPVDQLLTVRERQVIDLLVHGLSNRNIGLQLHITEETVKSHVRSILRKLHATTRADAVSRYLAQRIKEDA